MKIKEKGIICVAVVFILTLMMGVSISAAPKSGEWQKTSKGIKYVSSKGNHIKNKWKKINGKKYYFNKRGYRVTGWKTIDGKKYYFNKKGVMKTGWLKKDGKRYYFSKKGVMKTGWLKKNGKKYYFSEKGYAQTGWVELESRKYYFDVKGNMKTGWVTIDGMKYYFDEKGVMETGWLEIGDKKYFLNEKGQLETGWFKEDGKSYYAKEQTGEILTGVNKVGKYLYYFNEKGQLHTKDGKVKIDQNWYLVYNDGKLKTGWCNTTEGKFYYDEEGRQIIDTWMTHNGKKYHLDYEGKLDRNKWIDGVYVGYDGIPLEESVNKLQPQQGFLTKEILDEIDLSECSNLMIVAHPDDETLWGGGHIAEGGYFVVCLTNGYNARRKAEFESVIKETGNQGIILNYPDSIGGVRSDWSNEKSKILGDLNQLITYKNWGCVVTHNPNGEYGHIHHKMTCSLVTYSYNLNRWENKLYYFGKYYKKTDLSEYEKDLLKLPEQNLNEKIRLLGLYTSQAGAVNDSVHMAAYEDWKLAGDWE